MSPPSTSNDDAYSMECRANCSQDAGIIRVPKNPKENRRLKYGHIEDDNSDIAYLNLPVCIPLTVFTCISFICFIAAVLVSLRTDYIPSERELVRGFIVQYGSSRFRCNSSAPFPTDGWPSVFNLFELNVIGNVLFRYTACIPIIVRIFHAHLLRNLLRYEYVTNYSNVNKVIIDSIPLFTALEAISIALFSIITVHEDFPEANRFFKIVFAMGSVVNMLAITVAMFPLSTSRKQRLDTISVVLKAISSIIYCYFTPQYTQYHQSNITFPICHSYLPQMFAFMEYIIIASYLLFQVSLLIDVRHISFICYPRSSSGECEPIDPKNFQPGARYQYCRAFEYNQRRIMQL